MPSDHVRSASVAEQFTAEQLAVEARMHRRTVSVALQGELDLHTVSKVAEAIDGLGPRADGVRHVILDLRELTFMDSTGVRELLRQNEYARVHRHNLAVVRGSDAINRLLRLTGVDELLVLVDDPDDLAPPAAAGVRQPSAGTSVSNQPVRPTGARSESRGA